MVNAFKDAGLADLVFAPCAYIETDFEKINATTPLREMAQRAQRKGRIDSAELESWLRDLDKAIVRDRFTFCSTFIVVRGSRPRVGG